MAPENGESRHGEQKQRVVTYEAADRGAVCCLGCQAWVLILGGIGFGAWFYFEEGIWRVVIGAILVVGGFALHRYIAGRNRWEVSFDRDRQVMTLLTQERGTREVREIPFGSIEGVMLQEITRDISDGENVSHHRPVFRLSSGERVAVDPRLSIKQPDRAQEVLEEMRELLGLDARDADISS